MKTQILRLEPHDDVISARDKMGWGQTGRILLIWPDRGRVLTRRLDLVLLQRHSASLGAQLALVTRDPEVRFHARQLAIPVFKNLRKAQSPHWRFDRRRRKMTSRRWNAARWRRMRPFAAAHLTLPAKAENPAETSEAPEGETQAAEDTPPTPQALAKIPLPPNPRQAPRPLPVAARLGIFTLGVLALLSIAAVLLPGAQVTLTPKTQTQSVNLTVHARTETAAVNLSGDIPARMVSVVVEGRDSLPAQGQMSLPDKPASGQVVFSNLSDQAVSIPAGSVVRSQGKNPIRFATTRAGEVSAGEAITLTVSALTPGLAGNLPAQSLVAIEGSLGLDLSASNPQPTRGGTDRTVSAPTSYNRERLYEILQDSLRQTALQELNDRLAPGDLLLTLVPTPTQVLEKTYDPPEGQPGDQIQLGLRLEFQGLVASGEDLHALAASILDASLPEGFVPIPNTLEVDNLTQPEPQGENGASWRLHAQRKLQARLSAAQTASLSLGLSPAQARDRLQASLPIAGPPGIALTPTWWPRLPILPFRITLITTP